MQAKWLTRGMHVGGVTCGSDNAMLADQNVTFSGGDKVPLLRQLAILQELTCLLDISALLACLY